MPEPTFVFENADGDLFAVLPDAVVREDHGISARATENETEEGIALTDHVRDDADRFSCEMVISDTPIRTIEGNPEHVGFPVVVNSASLALQSSEGPIVERLARFEQGRATGVELGSGPVEIPSRVSSLQPDTSEVARTVDNWTVLRTAKSNAWLATIVTNLYTYRNMSLLSAETTLTADDGRWIRVEAIFREQRRVSTLVTTAAAPLEPRGRPQVNEGAQATTDADEDQSARLRSLLSRTGVGGLLR